MSYTAKNLKVLRNEANLSFQELEELTGIDEEILREFELGHLNPSYSQLVTLCRVLKMPVEDIDTRNLEEERRNATIQMKNTSRTNYNWYFGDRKRLMFLIGYIAYFFLGIGILGLIYYFKFSNIDFEMMYYEYQQHYIMPAYETFVFQYIYNEVINSLYIFGLGAAIFMVVDYYSRHTFVFHWYLLFFLGIIITLAQIIGLLASIPFLVIVIRRIVLKKY